MSRRRREMYCGHARLCVHLFLAAFPHYCTDPDVTLGNGRGPVYSYALLGRFAIVARCYDNIAPNAKCQRVLVLALYLVVISSHHKGRKRSNETINKRGMKNLTKLK